AQGGEEQQHGSNRERGQPPLLLGRQFHSGDARPGPAPDERPQAVRVLLAAFQGKGRLVGQSGLFAYPGERPAAAVGNGPDEANSGSQKAAGKLPGASQPGEPQQGSGSEAGEAGAVQADRAVAPAAQPLMKPEIPGGFPPAV